MYRSISLLCLFACAAAAQQPFQNGQAARAVVGQYTFTKGDQNSSGQVLGGAGGIAWAGNRLYVADSNRLGASPDNNRVLVFDTTVIPGPHTDLTTFGPVTGLTSCYVCGTPALFSMGQDTFTPPTYTPSGQSTPVTAFYNGVNGTQDAAGSNPTENAWLYNATAVASDGVHFAIADTDNNRVLLWNTIPTGNTHPDLVVGQPDFNTLQKQQLGVVNATSMRGPQGVWIANNRLYVADTQDYRVLIWNSWPTKNNQAPDVVLGQPDFTHANAPPPTTTAPVAAANQLLNPTSVTADGGHVFVSDLGFNRVLIWNTIAPTMDQNADVVIGQIDFMQTTANNSTVCYTTPGGSTALPTGTQGQCQASLNFPRFALSDGTRLFIADGGNDRVLIYNTIPTTNGVLADGVLGQTNFTNDIVTSVSISIVSTEVDNTGGVDTTPSPTSLAWDGTNLYVADPYNRRVLLFSAGDTQIPSPFNQAIGFVPVVNWASEIVRQEGTVTFSVTAGGKITGNDTATITIDSTTYTYTEKATDTVDNIAKALVALINKSDPNVSAIFGGAGTGTVYLSSLQKTGAEVTDLAYDTITLAAAASNTANVTVVTSGSYLSAGNAATASPFSLIEVNAPSGVTFTDNATTYIAPTNGGNIPNTVNGVQLYLDGFASPLFKVSPTQLVGQVPYFYGDRNSTSVYVRTVHNDGSVTVTNATPLYIAPANPGIFDAPQYPNQPRPWLIAQAHHQLGNPVAVVSVDGSPTANDTVTIFVNVSTAYTYTVQTNDTLQNIVTGLVNLMQNDPLVVPSAGGSFTRLVLTARDGSFTGGNGIPISAATGTTSAGISTCTGTASTATETLTPYGSSGCDSANHQTVNTCCAVQSGSLIYPANPAVPGELISISGAGLGVIQDQNSVTVSIATGYPYTGPAPPNNDVLSPNFVAATLGGESAQVIFAGFDPSPPYSYAYGIYRVDVLLPTGLTANATTPLYIAQNAFISNTVNLPVGNAVSNPPPPPPVVKTSPINMNLDTPVEGAQLSGAAQVGGWALDSSASISNVAIQIDGVTIGTASYGGSRPDACAVYPGRVNCPNVGYNYALDTTRVANGSHTLGILVTDASGLHQASTPVDITVSNDPSQQPTRLYIDTPTNNQVYHGVFLFAGWAFNATSKIVSLKAYIDGSPVDSSQITYGILRPDVCALFPGSPNCPNVGWSYLADLTQVADSTATGSSLLHRFTITAFAENGQQFSAANMFYVNNFDTTTFGPTVALDTPSASAATLSGTIQVGGWSIDPVAAISSMAGTVDGAPVSNFTVLYGGSRPDVCAVYTGSLGCPNVGFNALLDTTLLSDGTHMLELTAYPAQGQPFTVTRQITVGNLNSSANPVLIAIDTPSQSSSSITSYSGTAAFGGWAIANNSTAIQSVEVSVDGVVNGTASYGGSRPDVCAVFPGKTGCPNVGWNYLLDTTRLTDGTHSLEVTATTVGGKRATAGASFTVSNSSAVARAYIDVPGVIGIPFAGIANARGWAIKAGVAITSVTVTVDGVPNGTAIYGSSRPDVCVAFPGGSPSCPNVGWTYTLDTGTLLDGTHTFGIVATAADGTTNTSSSTFTVANWTQVQAMSIDIDSPNSGEPFYTGVNIFGGWLLEPNVSIAYVTVLVDGVPLGEAGNHGSRPDVCAVYSSPDCPNVGWSAVIDTSFLSNGQHTITVAGTTVAGQSATATRQFVTQN